MPTTLVPSTTTEALLIAKGVAPRYIKGYTDATYRLSVWLYELKKRGRIVFNQRSHSCTWSAWKSEPDVSTYVDGTDLTFVTHDPTEMLTLPQKQLYATDYLSQHAYEQMQGEQQIIDHYKEKMPRLVEAVQKRICRSLFNNGNTNTADYAGIETFMATGTTTSADKAFKPDANYAGQQTDLGVTGTWTSNLATKPNASVATDWPDGDGSSDYDWNSPLIVNYGYDWTGSGSSDWKDNCEEAARYMVTRQQRRGAAESAKGRMPLLHLLATDLLADFQSFISARNRQIMPYKDGMDYGFSSTAFFHDGALYDHEFYVPAGVGYSIGIDKMQLSNVTGELFNTKGPEYSLLKNGHLFFVYTHGNLRFNPRSFGKFATT